MKKVARDVRGEVWYPVSHLFASMVESRQGELSCVVSSIWAVHLMFLCFENHAHAI